MTEEQLDAVIAGLAEYAYDPLGFVMFAFPWGEEGTDLEDADGPEIWQREILTKLGDGVFSVAEAIVEARKHETEIEANPVRLGVVSGHGIGKSAFVAWIVWWAISTLRDTRGVVTANTENQLKTKTWVEIAKWHRLFIGKDLFKRTATQIYSTDPEHKDTWRIDVVPWSEKNTEAFAGLHNKNKRILVVFDEGSAIPDIIWEVTEGAQTDKNTEIIWCVCGNPTRNTGRFRDCFAGGAFAHRWDTICVDSRTVSFTNKTQINEWITDYGEDHDFVRIRVLGKFPRIDSHSFISVELVNEASVRVALPQRGMPLVLGVDVARFGDDPAVIYPRRGRDAKSFPITVIPRCDTMELAQIVCQQALELHAEWVFVDGGGVGGGVVDRLRQLQVNVYEVDFGGGSDMVDPANPGVKYHNKRAEIWGSLRTWLSTGCIPEFIPGLVDEQGRAMAFRDELSAPTFGMSAKERITLESKEAMRRRGIPSPNVADALACTFAMNVEVMGESTDPFPDNMLTQVATVAPDYDPYDVSRIYN